MPYPPYITAVQKATAREMSKVADQMGADFVLGLGDNFYYKGVDSVDSSWFKDTFKSVYTTKSLKIPVKYSLAIMTMQAMSKPRSSTAKDLTDGNSSLTTMS